MRGPVATRRIIPRPRFAFMLPVLVALGLFAGLAPAEAVLVPDVAGKPYPDARTALQGEKLKVETRKEHSSDVSKGLVIRTEPQADTSVAAGSGVTVFVSEGPPADRPSSEPPTEVRGAEQAEGGTRGAEPSPTPVGNEGSKDPKWVIACIVGGLLLVAVAMIVIIYRIWTGGSDDNEPEGERRASRREHRRQEGGVAEGARWEESSTGTLGGAGRQASSEGDSGFREQVSEARDRAEAQTPSTVPGGEGAATTERSAEPDTRPPGYSIGLETPHWTDAGPISDPPDLGVAAPVSAEASPPQDAVEVRLAEVKAEARAEIESLRSELARLQTQLQQVAVFIQSTERRAAINESAAAVVRAVLAQGQGASELARGLDGQLTQTRLADYLDDLEPLSEKLAELAAIAARMATLDGNIERTAGKLKAMATRCRQLVQLAQEGVAHLSVTVDQRGPDAKGFMAQLERELAALVGAAADPVSYLESEFDELAATDLVGVAEFMLGRKGEASVRDSLEAFFAASGLEDVSPKPGEAYSELEHELLDFAPGPRDRVIEVRRPGIAYKGKVLRKPAVIAGRG